MVIAYHKYHALQNDFFVVNQNFNKRQSSRLAKLICNRKSGVGADGIIYLAPSKKADKKIDIFNADGSWAEKSGNGLRIAGVHEYLVRRKKQKRNYFFETNSTIDKVTIVKTTRNCYTVKTELGTPLFETSMVPVKTKQKYMINTTLNVGGIKFPVTCLSIGNPHTVLFVDNFKFDWQTLGADIEKHRAFPNKTNVEFVKIINRRKIKVVDWERGAGATESSGTGAAAAVSAGVIMGVLERKCEVVFSTGSLFIQLSNETNLIELTGPVQTIARGTFEL